MRLGLVLSGGGARGAFEAGVAVALDDAGLRPSVLSGTSAGALNAAALAAGLSPQRLVELWTGLRDRDVYRQRRDVWRLLRPSGLVGGGNLAERLLRTVGWTWLWEGEPLRRTLRAALGGERVDVAPEAVLVVSAVEVTSGRLVRFASAPPPPHRATDRYRVVDLTVDHLLASAAIPLLFRPAHVASTPFWDGGIVANTPLAPALAYEPDVVVVVTTSTLPEPRPAPAHLADAVGRLLEVVQRYALEVDLAHAETINRLCAVEPAAAPDRRVVDLLLIEPVGVDLGDPLRFEPAAARHAVAAGRRIAREAIERWRGEGRLPL